MGGGAVSGDRGQGPKAGDGAAGVGAAGGAVGGVDTRAALARLWRQAMAVAALSGSGEVHSWLWQVAGDSKNLMSCSMTEDKTSLQTASQASIE